jgi:tetratricopeptide (TPR) repeat protein
MNTELQTPGQLLFTKLGINLDEVPIEQLSDYTAVEYYLTVEDEPSHDATNLEKVRGYLEAFHHCCEVEDWEKAGKILSLGLDTPTNECLHNQLGTWGYYPQQIEVYSRLLGKLNHSCDIICWAGIGNACQSLAKYRLAMRYYHKCVVGAREIGDRNGEGSALANLGNAYHSLGDYRQALEYLQQSLTISRKIGDRNGEGSALSNLGNAYHSIGEYPQAIEYHQQTLTIFREIDNRKGKGSALGNLGLTYCSIGEYAQAIEYHQQHLTIAREIGDRNGEGSTLGNLGNAYCSIGEYAQAIEYHQQHLTIARELAIATARE